MVRFFCPLRIFTQSVDFKYLILVKLSSRSSGGSGSTDYFSVSVILNKPGIIQINL